MIGLVLLVMFIFSIGLALAVNYYTGFLRSDNSVDSNGEQDIVPPTLHSVSYAPEVSPDESQLFNITAEDNLNGTGLDRVLVEIDNPLIGAKNFTANPSNGFFTLNYAGTSEEGEYPFRIFVFDRAGNVLYTPVKDIYNLV